MGPVGGNEFVYRWDSTRRLTDPAQEVAGDALYWVSARAEVDEALRRRSNR